MDAVNYLTQGHRHAEKLFSDFRATADSREELAGSIREELETHMEVEERVFYPAMQRAGFETEHGQQEHDRIKNLLQEFQGKDVDALSGTFERLAAIVQDHIREEEAPGGIMEQARQRFTELDLARLTEEMESIKTERSHAA